MRTQSHRFIRMRVASLFAAVAGVCGGAAYVVQQRAVCAVCAHAHARHGPRDQREYAPRGACAHCCVQGATIGSEQAPGVPPL